MHDQEVIQLLKDILLLHYPKSHVEFVLSGCHTFADYAQLSRTVREDIHQHQLAKTATQNYVLSELNKIKEMN